MLLCHWRGRRTAIRIEELRLVADIDQFEFAHLYSSNGSAIAHGTNLSSDRNSKRIWLSQIVNSEEVNGYGNACMTKTTTVGCLLPRPYDDTGLFFLSSPALRYRYKLNKTMIGVVCHLHSREGRWSHPAASGLCRSAI